VVQTPIESLTLAELLQLPETEPASEYVNGEIVQKPMPQGEHSAIQTELAPVIIAVKPAKLAWAFVELRCTFGDRSIVPDFSVFRWERIPRNENGGVANVFAIPPDWTIEIVSPGQSQTRVTKTILHCLQHGTQLGWLIDPGEQTVFVYEPDQPPRFYDEPAALLPVPAFAEAVRLTAGELFSWLLV